MIKRLLFHFADNSRSRSLATRMRRRRFALFEAMLREAPPSPKVLDVGGTVRFWETMGYGDRDDLNLVILNLKPAAHSRWKTVQGDARDLSRFEDEEFDLVLSNSVIEHVGTLQDQRRMADEIRRVGRGYFVQTPNRYFPIEPHFLFPLFQFLPRALRVGLVRRFALGWVPRLPGPEDATRRVESIRLLTASELRIFFPDGELHRERVLGWTKSFVVIKGPQRSSSDERGGAAGSSPPAAAG